MTLANPAVPDGAAYERFLLASVDDVRRALDGTRGNVWINSKTGIWRRPAAGNERPARGGDQGRKGFDRRRSVRPAEPARYGVQGTEFRMEIQSTRFGRLDINDERVMTFPNGLLGFPDHSRFALIQTSEENYFFWLQSIDDADLAFVVTDPTIFFKDYEVPLREETRLELDMQDDSLAQAFVICNKVGEWLTGNLLGPIVVNAQTRLAQQVVLTEKKWTTRQPLLKLQADVPLAKSA
jgi:flagellar assembly factor FliW